MTTPTRDPILDFIPDFPRSEPARQAWRRWWRETGWFIRHTLSPIPRELPEPARKVQVPEQPPSAEDLKRSLESMRKIVDSAEARSALLRTKATGLLGIVTILTPLLSWWLASGRDRVAGASLWLAVPAYCLIALAGCCLALALLAVFRTQRVVSFPALTPHHLLDLQTGHLKVHDPAAEVQVLTSVWAGIERWSDILADYLRAGQRFLGLSLIFAIAAGALAYLQPEPQKLAAPTIQVSGNPAVQTGAATITLSQPTTGGDVLLASLLSALLGAGIVLFTFYLFRRRST